LKGGRKNGVILAMRGREWEGKVSGKKVGKRIFEPSEGGKKRSGKESIKTLRKGGKGESC